MTTEKLQQILSKSTCNGMRELTEERSLQAMTEAVNAAIDECAETAEVEYDNDDILLASVNKQSITKKNKMKDKHRFTDAPEISVNNSLLCGSTLKLLAPYMGKYQISFQFWGEGKNNVFIDKDDVELYGTGGFETPYEALIDALNYLDRINKTK